jgi:DNA polymerase-3 subunit epsilon
MRQILIDTETTGLHVSEGHRVIEIAAVEMKNREKTGKFLHYYLNPGRAVDEGATRVHGITNEFLKDKPHFSSIAEPLFQFIDGAELIIHNAPFDLGFLNQEFSLCKPGWIGLSAHCRVLDTLVLAREKHQGARNSLDALCKRYKISNTHRKFHGALLDAELLADVYLAMTGGQINLFLEEDPSVSSDQRLVGSISAMKEDLCLLELKNECRVVRASAEELLGHERYLEVLEKSAPGRVLFKSEKVSFSDL